MMGYRGYLAPVEFNESTAVLRGIAVQPGATSNATTLRASRLSSTATR